MVVALKNVIEDKGLSLSELARRSGISNSYLSLITNGNRKNVRISVLVRLASELNISIQEVQTLIQEQYKVPKSHLENEKFRMYLAEVLDALDNNDMNNVYQVIEKIEKIDLQYVPLKSNFQQWHEGVKLNYQNRFNEGLNMFLSAQDFKPRFEIERRFRAKIMGSIGTAYIAQGNYKFAVKAFRDSLRLWNYGKQAGWIYLNMGTLYRRRHYYTHAKEATQRAIDLGAPFIRLLAYSNLVQIAFDLKNNQEARKHLLSGYLLAKSLKDSRGKSELFCNFGKYYHQIGKLAKAEKCYLKSIKFAENDIRLKHYALVELADLYVKSDKLSMVDDIFKQIESELTDSGDFLLIGINLNTIGKKYLKEKHAKKAIIILEKCYRLLKNIPPSKELELCCEFLYKAHKTLKDPFIADFYNNELKIIKTKIAKSTKLGYI